GHQRPEEIPLLTNHPVRESAPEEPFVLRRRGPADLDEVPPASSDDFVPPGTVLDGKYVVGGVLAEGGMGVVCTGHHAELGHPVAIKFLRQDASDRPSMVQRFLNEARAAASLRGEHVVRVLDVGQMETGRPYFVMERLRGIDLEHLVAKSGPVPADRALEYVLQTCRALTEAHQN